jgi:Uma2 family endonuclease
MATGTMTEAPPEERAVEPAGLYEVVDGEVREVPHMGAFEAELAMLLGRMLDVFAREHGLGRAAVEMLFRIDPGRKLQRRPDVAFVSAARWPIDRRAPRAAAWDVVPDLAVEVISPTNQTGDDAVKLEDYFRAGVRAVWIVHPAVEKVYAYDSPTAVRILARGDTLDGGALLPGFRLAVADLFGPEEPR